MIKPTAILVFTLLVMIELFRTAAADYPFQHVNRATKVDRLQSANAIADGPRVLGQGSPEQHSRKKYQAALLPAEE